MLSADLSVERLFYRPPAFNAMSQGAKAKPHPLRPRPGGHRNSTELNVFARSGVLGLLKDTRPSAVTWFVIAVVVDPLDAEARRTRPHVREEVPEVVPSVAKRNAAPGIIRMIAASMLDAIPYLVFPRSAETVFCGSLSRQTSATSDAAITEIPAFNHRPFTAIANASPISDFGLAITTADHAKATELLPGYIDQFHSDILSAQKTMGG